MASTFYVPLWLPRSHEHYFHLTQLRKTSPQVRDHIIYSLGVLGHDLQLTEQNLRLLKSSLDDLTQVSGETSRLIKSFIVDAFVLRRFDREYGKYDYLRQQDREAFLEEYYRVRSKMNDRIAQSREQILKQLRCHLISGDDSEEDASVGEFHTALESQDIITKARPGAGCVEEYHEDMSLEDCLKFDHTDLNHLRTILSELCGGPRGSASIAEKRGLLTMYFEHRRKYQELYVSMAVNLSDSDKIDVPPSQLRLVLEAFSAERALFAEKFRQDSRRFEIEQRGLWINL